MAKDMSTIKDQLIFVWLYIGKRRREMNKGDILFGRICLIYQNLTHTKKIIVGKLRRQMEGYQCPYGTSILHLPIAMVE